MVSRPASLFIIFSLSGLCLYSLFLCGCQGSSQKTDTSVVSQKDLENTHTKMHVSKDLQIEPKGYSFEQFSHGITGTFFKFVAKSGKIENVFASDIDISKFHPNAMLTDYRKNSWWDVNGKNLTGGNIILPGNITMSVGYWDNKDGTLTVYTEM